MKLKRKIKRVRRLARVGVVGLVVLAAAGLVGVVVVWRRSVAISVATEKAVRAAGPVIDLTDPTAVEPTDAPLSVMRSPRAG